MEANPLVKVYTLMIRNPLLKGSVFGTLFETQSKEKIKTFQNHPNYTNDATQLKVVTRLFRKDVADKKFPLVEEVS